MENIYLHYALDLWFEKVIKRNFKCEAEIVRYTDDFVCCFQYEGEARNFYRFLSHRLGKFNLESVKGKVCEDFPYSTIISSTKFFFNVKA